jgi:putative DNA primase/helicase
MTPMLCLKIKNFLKSTLDDENIAKVIRMMGYCLLPNCKHQKAFMFVGQGSNGKSTLINLIQALIGKDNVSNVSLQGLSERFAKAQIYQKRINTFADIPNKKITETGIFKMLVSGDSMFVEKKGKDGFSFNNYAKLIFSANDIPQSDDESDAYYRRWTIIPFRHVFNGDSDDKDLLQKITAPEELSGLLNAAIAALKALDQEGGFSNESIEEVRAVYATNASRVKDFIEEICLLEKDASIEADKLQQAYSQYAHAKGDRVLDETMLGKELKRLGVEHKQRKIGGKNKWYYRGIAIKSETLSQG